MSAAPVLAGFDPGPEIRRSVRGQERHRVRLRRTTRELTRFARLDEGARARALEAHLAALRAALWRSRFYCTALRARGLSPADLRRIEDLRHFPLLGRDALRAGFTTLPALPARGPVSRLFVERSSGSTGQPVSVLKEDYDSVHMWAVLRFWSSRLGLRLPPRPRIALLCTLPHGVEYRTPLPALRGTLERISLVRPEPGARLVAFRPDVIFTDPAGLHSLAGRRTRGGRGCCFVRDAAAARATRARRREARRARPRLLLPGGTGPIACECLAAPGRFHVLLPDVFVESVTGELVRHAAARDVLPLLRYRTGDAGQVERDTCRSATAASRSSVSSAAVLQLHDPGRPRRGRVAPRVGLPAPPARRLPADPGVGRSVPLETTGDPPEGPTHGSSSDSAERSGRSAGPRRASSTRVSHARLSRPQTRGLVDRSRALERTTHDPAQDLEALFPTPARIPRDCWRTPDDAGLTLLIGGERRLSDGPRDEVRSAVCVRGTAGGLWSGSPWARGPRGAELAREAVAAAARAWAGGRGEWPRAGSSGVSAACSSSCDGHGRCAGRSPAP